MVLLPPVIPSKSNTSNPATNDQGSSESTNPPIKNDTAVDTTLAITMTTQPKSYMNDSCFRKKVQTY